MADLNAALAAWSALFGVVLTGVLSGPVRTRWRKARARRKAHHLDHEGRPARIDESTGRVIEPAQPGIASMIGDMHARQLEIGAKVAVLADTSGAIAEIRQMLKEQALENDKRHAENGEKNAKLGEQVHELRTMANEAATQAKDAAGHAARIDRQQKELAEHMQAEFERQRAWTGAYVTALSDIGMQIEPPELD